MSELLTPNSTLFFTKQFCFSKLIEDSLRNFPYLEPPSLGPTVTSGKEISMWMPRHPEQCTKRKFVCTLGSAKPLALVLQMKCVYQSTAHYFMCLTIAHVPSNLSARELYPNQCFYIPEAWTVNHQIKKLSRAFSVAWFCYNLIFKNIIIQTCT